MFIFNNLKILTNGLVTPFGHYPGIFVPRSDSIEPENETQAKIQDLWFNNSSKMRSLEREPTFSLSKPRKLTPINSIGRKKSEMIAHLEQKLEQLDITRLPTESVFSRPFNREEDNKANYDDMTIHNGRYSPPCIEFPKETEASIKTPTSTLVINEEAKLKPIKKTKKKKKVIKKVSSSLTANEVDTKTETRIDQLLDLSATKKDKIVKISKFASTEEMPANTIDYIWDVNRLNLLLEDATQCLGSIKEDLPIP